MNKIDRRKLITQGGLVVASTAGGLLAPNGLAAVLKPEISNLSLSTVEIQKRIEKVKHFDSDFSDDIKLDQADWKNLLSVVKKLDAVKKYVGAGNFNLLSFDQMLVHTRRSPVPALTVQELHFLEKIFFTNATTYGFYGEKVTNKLTDHISESKVRKIPGTGHYLYVGRATEMYEQIRNEIGESIYLTSGIRSIVKQMHLFLRKAARTKGNMSKASRSLAPPGHSFHGIGDFDVGKKGLGYLNFTSKFANTDEYRRMIDLGHIKIRYTENNLLGVRHEPWHIRVVS